MDHTNLLCDTVIIRYIVNMSFVRSSLGEKLLQEAICPPVAIIG